MICLACVLPGCGHINIFEVHMHTVHTVTLETLPELAKQLADRVQHGGVLTLTGELGAGKTTFTKLLATEFGVEAPITSPTFSIMNIHPIDDLQSLFHLDLYRIKNSNELEGIGLIEIFEEPKNIVVIEWPEVATPFLPEHTIHLQFKTLDEQTREITILG